MADVMTGSPVEVHKSVPTTGCLSSSSNEPVPIKNRAVEGRCEAAPGEFLVTDGFAALMR